MSFKTSDLSSNSELGGKIPAKKIDFTKVIEQLKKHGSSAGFRELRNFLIGNFNQLKNEFGASNVISLAINCDKHAIFADMAETKGKEDSLKKWDWFQSYMKGTAEVDSEEPEQEDEDAEAESILPVTEETSEFGELSDTAG